MRQSIELDCNFIWEFNEGEHILEKHDLDFSTSVLGLIEKVELWRAEILVTPVFLPGLMHQVALVDTVILLFLILNFEIAVDSDAVLMEFFHWCVH